MSLLLLFNQGDPDVVSALLPTPDDVALLMRARLTDQGGDPNANATFTDSTVPTRAQVQGLIDLVNIATLVRLPTTVPEAQYPAVKYAVALKVAATAERSYFPEQIAQGSSPVDGYEADFASIMEGAVAASQEDQPGGVRAYSVPVGTVVANSWPGLPVETELLP